MAKILLVEDDMTIIKTLTQFLKGENFEVKNVRGQDEAINLLEECNFDLVLLDVSLADGNGFAVCSFIKNNNKLHIPVIFLTASGDEYSTVTGLDMGADDYISKPFRPRELLSRIKNVLRHYQKHDKDLSYKNIRIDTVKGIALKNEKDLYLSALEYRILLVFMNNQGVIISRNKLLQEIWDVAGDFVNDNTLTVYIKRLREKMEQNPSEPEIIKTVRGMGYKMG